MSETIISIENLSKAYPIYARPTDMIREVLTGRPHHDVFWALKDISFSIHEKQRVGIIGPNGAGKTTLLKIITGNLPPTSGSIMVNGKISAMLSLVSSLNPEETGLSNIRFNLILNGCPSSAINRLTEEIVDFIELGAFIYRPVKTYSSGMNARLAFAIATAIEPEILVIDEVLGAGDGYFIGKATKRMIDLCNRGKALVFVSHSIGSVQMLCDSVVWMENGSIRMTGLTDYVLKLYEEDYRKQEDRATRSGNAMRSNQTNFNVANLSEIQSPDYYRMRITPINKTHTFKDTHYIRKIIISGDKIEKQGISLSAVDVNKPEFTAALDLIGSEWSRLFVKDGSECRTIFSQTGKNKGGHIIVKVSPQHLSEWHARMTFETISITGEENLGVEILNFGTGNWESASIIERSKLENGWQSITVDINIPLVSNEQYQQTLQIIEQRSKPVLEILGIKIFAEEEPAYVINEKQPFEIRIHIKANQRVPLADVMLNIYRSDGVYVFWQSSGMVGHNLRDLEGELIVCFIFEENYFGPGEYQVGATCGNGWDPVNNFPHTEVFDFIVNEAQFSIKRQFERLSVGQINIQIPIKLLRPSDISTDD